MMVLTDPNFDYFNNHAYDRKRFWDASSAAFFDILEIVNVYFDLTTLDERITYVEELQAKKLAVKFKFWIDTERLYCLLFLGLDDILYN
jgi:hypothetical protein